MARLTSSRVAHRYARSLMELAKEEGAFDVVAEDVRTLGAVVEASQELRTMLDSPVIDDRTKATVLHEIFAGKVGTIMDRFITLLTVKGRSADLRAIVIAFDALLDSERNVEPAEITTAVELGAEQRAAVEGHIQQLRGMTIRATYRVDPALIGGFKARVADTMLDASVRNQLERLRHSLIEGQNN